MVVLAIDPGSKKCGLAVVASDGGVLKRMIVPVHQVSNACQGLANDYELDEVLVGGSTGSRGVELNVASALGRKVRVVNEKYSTERAKKRYFEDHPPKGLQRLLPEGLLYPPVPFDDYAAVVMAEDFLSGRNAEVRF